MSKVNIDAKIVTVLEKKVHANTTGRTVVSSFDGDLYASNFIKTDKIQTVMFEDEEGNIFSSEFINHDLEVPDGRKIAIAGSGNYHLAYISSQKSEIKPLNHFVKPIRLNQDYLGIFMSSLIPVINVFYFLRNFKNEHKYYENNEIKSSTIQNNIGMWSIILAVLLTLACLPLGEYVLLTMTGVVLFASITVIVAAFYTINTMLLNKKIINGNKNMFNQAAQSLERLRSKL